MNSRILVIPLHSSECSAHSPNTKALEIVLNRCGHQAAYTDRGQVSAELLETNDAVFLEMIKEDDLRYFEGLRRQSRKPVLIYGTGIPRSMQIESLRIGADAFLALPDSPEVLEAKVRAFLRRSGLEPFSRGAYRINNHSSMA